MGWVTAAYDEAGWKSGPAVLGYGDEGLDTTIGSGSGPEGVALSYYFRRSVVVAPDGKSSYLIVRIRRDDGALVFINGQEIFRSNMGPAPVTPRSMTPSIVSGEPETTYFDFPVAGGLLRPGANQLAVSLHQRDGTSSDLHFDMEIVGVAAGVSTSLGTMPSGWYAHYPSAVLASGLNKTPLLMYLHSGRDQASRSMSLETFGGASMEELLSKNMVRFQFDVDRVPNKAALNQFKLKQLPTTLAVGTDKKELFRLEGAAGEIRLERELEQDGLIAKK